MLSTDRLCPGCMNDNGGEAVCPVCGYDASESNAENQLPIKFWINNRYLVGRSTDANGEGISYIGWDNGSDSIVTIREYFPEGAAIRNPDKTVSIASGREYDFNEGLMEFLDINRTLRREDFPAAVKVLAVFEENGTAYAIISRVSGITLEDFLVRNGGTLKWEQARPLFIPLIDTIGRLHGEDIIHRGISPETILVSRDGKLHLTGICIKNIRIKQSSLQPQIYHGYAPIELYGVGNYREGPATDVYGICATLFRVLIGTVPPDAEKRLENDSMTIPAKFAEELPRHVLVALANGLQVIPSDRTVDIEKLRNELVYGETAPVVPKEKAAAVKEPDAPKSRKKGSSAKAAIISAACTTGVFLIIAGLLVGTVFRDRIFQKPDTPDADDSILDSAPSIESIGTYDSDAIESTTLYSVPDLAGKYYAEVVDNTDYEKFKLVIKGKDFSSKYAKGQICAQSVTPGTNVEKDTVIELTISLGPSEIKIADVTGLDEASAKIELLKQGFLYDNIEVIERYDPSKEPKTIVNQEPKYGTLVSTDIAVKIFINSYKEEDDTGSAGGASIFGSNRNSVNNR